MGKKGKNNKKYIFTGIIAIVLIIIIVLILLLSCNRSYNVELDVDNKLYYQATIHKGDTLKDIEPPIKKGYVFVGWYVDGEKFDLDTPITEDLKLEARWEKSVYTITFDFDNGQGISKVEVGANGKVTRPANPTKSGYDFLGWYVDNKEFDFNTEITDDVTITAKWSEITTAKYMVEHYLMGTDGKYSNTPTDRDVYIGTIGTTASPNVKTYKGFTSPKVESKIILKNDATVIKYYYTRNKYTLTIEGDDGVIATNSDGTYYYGEKVKLNYTIKEGYSVNSFSEEVKDDVYVMGDKNITITLTTKPNTDTKYTVKHYIMGLDGEYKDEPDYVDNLNGTTDTTVTAKVRELGAGFVIPSEEEITITGDGKAVVEYRYERKQFTLTLVKSATLGAGIESLEGDGTYYFGTKVKVKAVIKEGYTFVSWDPVNVKETEFDYEIPSSNIILIASATPNTDTKYTVRHYIMGTDGKYPIEPNYVDNLKGTTDTTVTAKVRELGAGFVIPSEEEITITGDGKAVVEYRYERRQFTLTLEKSVYASSNGIESLEGDGLYYYGQSVTVTANVKEGYTFTTWQPIGIDKNTFTYVMPAANMTLTAGVKPNTDTKYTVKHYIMGTDGKYQTIPDYTDVFTGTTDTTVTAKVRKLGAGFITPSEEKVTITGDGKAVVEYRYERRQFTLTLTLGTGIASVEGNGLHYYGESVTITANVKEGYTFASWQPIDIDTNTVTYVMPASDATLTASATPNNNTEYTVEYYLMGTDGEYPTEPSITTKQTGTTDTTVVVKPSDLGAGFKTPRTASVTITGDGKAVVKFQYERNKFTLRFAMRGDFVPTEESYNIMINDSIDYYKTIVEDIDKLKFYYEENVKIEVVMSDGIHFDTWEGSNIENRNNAVINYKMPASDANLPFRLAINKYTIEFNGKGGVTSDGNDTYTQENVKYSIKNNYPTLKENLFTRKGYDFAGWSKNDDNTPDDDIKLVDGSYKLSANLTAENGLVVPLYACWEIKENSVIFKLNYPNAPQDGVYETYEEQQYGEKIDKPSPDPTREGYKFDNWYQDAEGNTVWDFGSDTMGEVGLQLYAKWIPINYNLEYYYDNGIDSAPVKDTATYEQAITLKDEPNNKKQFNVTYNKKNDEEASTTQIEGRFVCWTIDGVCASEKMQNGELKNLTTTENGTVELHAKWEYTLTLDNSVTKKGYHLDGWSLTDDGDKIEDKQTYDNDVNLYALWLVNKANVIYHSNNGEDKTVEAEFTYGNDAFANNDFTKQYTITYYNEDNEITKETVDVAIKEWLKDNKGSSYTVQDLNKDLESSHNITVNLYASWGSKDVTLKTSEDKEISSTTKTGYKLTGWSLNKNGDPVGEKYTVNSNLKLYAVWTPVTYNLEYYYDNGIDKDPVKDTATYDKAITLKGEPNNKKQFNVTYNKNNGEGATTTQITGRFVCWTIDGVCTSSKLQDGVLKNLTTAENGTVQLHAKWEYTLTLDNSVTKKGYHLDGWSLTDSGSKIDDNGTYDKDVSLYALWLINKAKVIYHSNNGVDTTIEADFTYNDASFAPNSFTKQYTITYYNEDNEITKETVDVAIKEWLKDNKGSSYTVQDLNKDLESSHNITVNLYASWGSKVVTLKTNKDISTIKTGYKLTGWSLSKNGDPVGETYTVSSNLNLYALLAPIKYKVKFDANANDVKGSMSVQEFTYDGKENTLATNGFTKDGYHFMGWSTDKSTVKYHDGAKVNDNLASEEGKEVTLYAVWEANKVNITYHENNGTTTDKTEAHEFTYGSESFATISGFSKNVTIHYDYRAGSELSNKDNDEPFVIKCWSKDKKTCYDVTTLNASTEFKNNTIEAFDLYALWQVPLDVPTREDYVFGGWTTESNIPSKLEDSFLKDNILGYTTTDFEPQFTGQYKYAEASDFDKETTLYAVWWDIPYISSVSFQLGKVSANPNPEELQEQEFEKLPAIISPDIKVGHVTGKKKTAIYVRIPETKNYFVNVFTLSVGVTQPVRLNLLSEFNHGNGDIYATTSENELYPQFTLGVGFGGMEFPFTSDNEFKNWYIPYDIMKASDPDSAAGLEMLLQMMLTGDNFATALSGYFLQGSALGVANRFGCNGLACSPHYTSIMYAANNKNSNGFAGSAINGYTYYFMATDDAIADPYTLTYKIGDKVIYSFQVPKGTPIPDIGLTGTDQEGEEFSVTGWKLNGVALGDAVAEGVTKEITIVGT